MTLPSTRRTSLRLDVRPILATGGEPFDVIMQAADRIGADNELELTAPFDPVPLYAVMRRRGFARTGRAHTDLGWVVTFRETGIAPSATVAEIARRHPTTAGVLAKWRVDLCCGGSKALEFAAKAHGIDLDRLLEELQAAAVS